MEDLRRHTINIPMKMIDEAMRFVKEENDKREDFDREGVYVNLTEGGTVNGRNYFAGQKLFIPAHGGSFFRLFV